MIPLISLLSPSQLLLQGFDVQSMWSRDECRGEDFESNNTPVVETGHMRLHSLWL